MNVSRKVLIVADDAAVAKSLEQAVSGKGCVAETSPGGEDALWKIDNNGYAAVFTDMELRGMSGLELAEEVYARRLRVAFAIVTASDPKTLQQRAAAAGVAAVLRKPLSAQQLTDLADQVLKTAEAVAPPKIPEAKVARASPMTLFAARLRNIILFLLAPVLGLVYILLFPVIGLGAFVWFGVKMLTEKREIAEKAGPPLPAAAKPGVLKTIVMLLGVVVVGVAYGIVGPILGIVGLIWFAFEAWGKLGAKALKAGET